MRRTSAHPTLVLPYAGRNHTLGSASGKSLMLGSEPRLVGPLSNTNIGIGAHVMSFDVMARRRAAEVEGPQAHSVALRCDREVSSTQATDKTAHAQKCTT